MSLSSVPKRLAVVLCIFSFSCSSSKINTSANVVRTADSLPATSLQPVGRYLINNDQAVELITSAANFGFSFEGKLCAVNVSLPNKSGHSYLQYELDGVYEKRIRIEGTSTQPIIITAQKERTHTVNIYKATEAHTGGIVIEKISGRNVKPTKAVAPDIEFIGNSITCGAAADPSEVPCGTGEYHDQHNAYYAYGPRVARALHTNFILSSVSGIGAYRNWNSDGPTMPQVYEKTNFQDRSPLKWNFSLFSPRVVSIALGTNDFSNGDGKRKRLPFDSAAFVSSYINFVQLVKSKYPRAQIALLSSPMVNGKARITLQNCLIAVKQKIDTSYPADRQVALHFFEPMQARGCSGHPNVEDHKILADELVPFFKRLLQ